MQQKTKMYLLLVSFTLDTDMQTTSLDLPLKRMSHNLQKKITKVDEPVSIHTSTITIDIHVHIDIYLIKSFPRRA